MRRRELLAAGLAGALLARLPGCKRPLPRPRHAALWTQACYLMGERPSTHQAIGEAEVAAYADLLVANRLTDAYLFAGPYNDLGRVPAYPSAAFARRSLEILRQRAPGVRLLPWLGGLQFKQVHLENPAWRAAAVAGTRELLETLGLDSVHVNYEFLLFGKSPPAGFDYYARFTDFFAELRAALPHAFISTVIPSTVPAIKPWKQQPTMAEVLAFLPHVDQLAVLFYDTRLHRQADFVAAQEVQLDHFAVWKTAAPRIELLVGTGTFVNHEPEVAAYRDLALETIGNSMAVLRAAIARRERGVVDGIAIYCDWETDADEWRQLRESWLDHQNV